MTLRETKSFTYWLLTLLFITSIWIALFRWVDPPALDSTDSASGERSGMQMFIDYQTRCEYLANPKGGITPRLSKSGQHLGCK